MDYEIFCYECNEPLVIKKIDDEKKEILVEPCTYCLEAYDTYDDGWSDGHAEGYAEAEQEFAEEEEKGE